METCLTEAGPACGDGAHMRRPVTDDVAPTAELSSGTHRWTTRSREWFERNRGPVVSGPGRSGASPAISVEPGAGVSSTERCRLSVVSSQQATAARRSRCSARRR